jgi:DNA-binding PadR family transcriptional regulator
VLAISTLAVYSCRTTGIVLSGRTDWAGFGYDRLMPETAENSRALGQMTVLGLIIRQPSNASSLKTLLDEECPWGQWSRGYSYKSTEKLVARGFIRISKAGRNRPSEAIYEHTEHGLDVFLDWVAKEATVPEPIRDALLLWLILAQESELPQILATLRLREQTAMKNLETALALLNRERFAGAFGPSDGSDFKGRMLYLVRSFQVGTFRDTVTRLKKMLLLAENLGEVLKLADSDVYPA